jgi:hypothetical protein
MLVSAGRKGDRQVSNDSLSGTATDGRAGGGRRDALFEDAIDQIRQALAGLRFGEVSVIVQDGVVVQLERRERKRLRSSQQQ